MKCPECGSEVASGERFCGNCGAPIERETAPSEEQEPTPSSEATGVDVTIVEAPGQFEAKAKMPEEGPIEEEQDIVSTPPPLPGEEGAAVPPQEGSVPPSADEGMESPHAEEIEPPLAEEPATPPPEEGPVVAPPEETRVPPPPPPMGAAPPPPSYVPPRQGRGTPWLWVIVAIVIIILALCCCGLIVIGWLVAQGNTTGMIAPSGLPLLL
jgi:hypothetical protein